MLAWQVQAGLAMRGLAAIRANISTAPTDYDHYWHPSKFLDSDDHAGSLDGTMYGGLDESSEGWAMGTDDGKYVVLSGPISNSTSYTVSCWVKPDIDAMNLNVSGGWVISDRQLSSPTGDFDFYYWKATGSISAKTRGDSGSDSAITTNVTDSIWQQFVMAVDYVNSTIELFKNGESVNSLDLVYIPQNVSTVDATFGTASWSPTAADTKYHGSMDSVKIWADRALTTNEVKQLYKLGRSK